VKEFLSQRIKDLEVIDVLNTPGGMEQLLKLGVRKVPCVAVGERYTFGQSLQDVATFLGITFEHETLSPERLIAKYLELLAAGQRMIRQIPVEKMDERVIANRPRTIRAFAYHIVRIAECYLLTYEGAEFSEALAQAAPPDNVGSAAEIVAYGEAIRARLARWWDTTTDRACQKPITTYYGVRTAHDVLERCTWHTAQHCRQLAAVLDRFGIQPDGAPTQELLAGLPLPERLWE
jgi:hypothetical protein